MSDSSSQQPEKPMSPLERVKARQAEQARNRAAKNKMPDPNEEKGGSGAQGTSKPMRSSANKSGG